MLLQCHHDSLGRHFLLAAPDPPSSASPTQPSSASSWQPLHTPRLRVSLRRRKRSNSALALGLNVTEAAQPVRAEERRGGEVLQNRDFAPSRCLTEGLRFISLFAFSRSQDICVAESSDKHDGLEGVQSEGAGGQVLHGDVPDLWGKKGRRRTVKPV